MHGAKRGNSKAKNKPQYESQYMRAAYTPRIYTGGIRGEITGAVCSREHRGQGGTTGRAGQRGRHSTTHSHAHTTHRAQEARGRGTQPQHHRQGTETEGQGQA